MELFPTVAARTAFSKTPQYAQIMKLLEGRAGHWPGSDREASGKPLILNSEIAARGVNGRGRSGRHVGQSIGGRQVECPIAVRRFWMIRWGSRRGRSRAFPCGKTNTKH